MDAIDALFLVLGVDSKPLADGLKSAISAVDTSTKSMVQNAGDNLNKFEEKFKNVASTLMRNVVAPITAAFGIGKMFGDYVADVDALNDLSEALNINISELQGWQEAVRKCGGNSIEFENATRSLNYTLSQIALIGTSRVAPIFEEMGVKTLDAAGKARKSTDVMLDMADALSKVGKSEALSIGEKLGFDSHVIELLHQGREGVERLVKEGKEFARFTKGDVEEMDNYKKALSDLNKAFGDVSTMLIRWIIPPVSFLYRLLSDFARAFREHPALWIAAGVAIAYFAKGLLATAIPAIVKFTTATWAAIAPLLPLIAAVAAVILAVDDFQTYLDGGDSALSSVWEKLGTPKDLQAKIQAFFKMITDGWATVKTWVSDFAKALEPLAGILTPIADACKSIWEALKSVGATVKDYLLAPFEAFGMAWNYLFGGGGSKASASVKKTEESFFSLKGVMEGVARAISIVAELIEFISTLIKKAFDKAREFLDWLKNLSLVDAAEKIKNAWNNCIQYIKDVWNNWHPMEVLSSWASAIREWWDGCIKYIKEKFANALDAVIPDWLRDFLGMKPKAATAAEQQAAKSSPEVKKAIAAGATPEQIAAATQAAVLQARNEKAIADAKRNAAEMDFALWGGNVPEALAGVGSQSASASVPPAKTEVSVKDDHRSETHVTVQKVEIQTQATDAQGIANAAAPAVKGAVEKQVVRATNVGVAF